MDKKNTHGGLRKGAGRKSIYNEETVRVRVPKSMQPLIHKMAKRMHLVSNNMMMGEVIPLPKKDDVTLKGRPLFSSTVPAGFPSPADDYIEAQLDLNEYVGANKSSVFYCRVSGESMIGAGIFDQDILVVDKSVEPRHRDVVVAVVNSELTVKRLYKKQGQVQLHPENPHFPVIHCGDETELVIWGVVTNVTRKLRQS